MLDFIRAEGSKNGEIWFNCRTRGHPVPDVAQRLGVAEGVLYTWVKKFKKADEPVASGDLKAMQAEMAKLKAELRRQTAL